jgi:CRISPR/Cas system CMR-associated protein Cmr3 (group 5 of RAMP superfamily)
MEEEDARELAIAVIDEFEELLAEHGIKIPSGDRKGNEEEACLYGSEYYALEDGIVAILMDRVVGYVVGKRGCFGLGDRAACERMRRRMAEAARGR